MDWDKLRLFYTVAEAGSLTEAARRLGLGQPALSRHIQSLERDLGAVLFHRHARGLALTHEGEQLLRAAGDVAERIASATRAIAATRDRPTGELRVTTTATFGATWLAGHMAAFLHHCRDMNIRLLVSDEDLDLSTRQADVALWFHAPVQGDLVQQRLVSTRYYICAAPEYLEKYGAPHTTDDLDRHALVSYGEPTPPSIRDANWVLRVGRARAPRSPALTVNSMFGVLNALKAGAGIGALPGFLLNQAPQLVTVLADVPSPTLDLFLVYPKELRGSVRVRVFRDFIITCLKQDGFGHSYA